jgi:hypothetical protein
VQCTLAELIKAPPLVMQALTSGPPALSSSLFASDNAKLDALLTQ